MNQPADPAEETQEPTRTLAEGETLAEDDSTTHEPGAVLLEDYEVEALLGRGGMGSVYRVRSRATGRRFALKRIRPELVRDPRHRLAFLRELQTWSELPEHPHLAALRFFHSHGDEILLFADCVEGGSVRDRSRRGELAETSDVLDVAVQSAWGLAAAHRLGIVHQDVKPGNLLMAQGGTVKVTDFGLAVARGATADSGPGKAAEGPDLVPTLGSTPAYASPEQLDHLPVGPATDVWSWGLTLLDLWCGGAFWVSGRSAREVLEAVLRDGPPGSGRSPLPEEVARVLLRCFESDPERRWATLREPAAILAAAYRRLRGEAHPRREPRPRFTADASGEAEQAEPSRSPRDWLLEILERTGGDPASCESLGLPRGRSLRARGIAELALLEDAGRLLAVAGPREDPAIARELAEVWEARATRHRRMGDLSGTLEHRARAAGLLGEWIHAGSSAPELRGRWTEARRNLGTTLYMMGKAQEAEREFRGVVESLEAWIAEEPTPERRSSLAQALGGLAVVVELRGDMPGALELAERGVEIMEQVVAEQAHEEAEIRLSWLVFTLATLYSQDGRQAESVRRHEQAIRLRERLVRERGRRDLLPELTKSYANQAVAHKLLGDSRRAADRFDQGIALREEYVRTRGMARGGDGLAALLLSKGNLLFHGDDYRGAAELYERSIRIWEELVEEQGRTELYPRLAQAYANSATLYRQIDEQELSIRRGACSIQILERLVGPGDLGDRADTLALAYMAQSTTLQMIGRSEEALDLMDRALELRRRMVQEAGQENRRGDLELVRLQRAWMMFQVGRDQEARRETLDALASLEAEIERTGRPDLRLGLERIRPELDKHLDPS